MKLLYTFKEAQALLGIGKTKFYELLAEEDGLRTVKVGRSRMVAVHELDRFYLKLTGAPLPSAFLPASSRASVAADQVESGDGRPSLRRRREIIAAMRAKREKAERRERRRRRNAQRAALQSVA